MVEMVGTYTRAALRCRTKSRWRKVNFGLRVGLLWLTVSSTFQIKNVG